MASILEKAVAVAMGDPVEALSSQVDVTDKKDVPDSSETSGEGTKTNSRNLEPAPDLEAINLDGCAPTDVEKINIISDGLNNFENLNPEAWEAMTPEQRLDLLSQVENFVSDVTLRPPCDVVMETMDSDLNGYNLGDKIALNKELLQDGSASSMEQALKTVLHEGRHAYQNWNIDVAQVEPNSELVDSWRLNRDMGYQNGECGPFDFQQMGLKKYLTQPVEVDARVFAESVLQATNLNIGGYYA